MAISLLSAAILFDSLAAILAAWAATASSSSMLNVRKESRRGGVCQLQKHRFFCFILNYQLTFL